MHKPATNKSFIISLSITAIAYAVIFNLILAASEISQVGMLGYIPVILFSWIYGLKRGVISALFILLGMAMNFTFFAPPSVAVSSVEPYIGAFSHFILAALFGILSDTFRDLRNEIVTRKKIEDELRDYKERLENLVKERTAELEEAHVHLRHAEKMEALGQLTGGIIHDFNNMLYGIIGYAELINRKYGQDDPTLEKYTKIIFETSEQAAELISKLLSFSRKGEMQVEPIYIYDLINNTIKLLEHSLGSQVKLSQDMSNESLIVMGDYTQLQNVFINLAINARDAMPEGGELTFATDVITISRKYAPSHPLKLAPGPYIMISVSDTGVGIGDELKTKIFEPFFTTKEKGKGTGMGLASAYGTVKNHLGLIEVYSEQDKGTTFKIYLPRANEYEEEGTKTGVFFGKQSGKVLLIDDEEIMRTIGSEMLTDLGFTVFACEDGRKGIEFYKSNYKDISYVILDIMMPNFDGFSCLRELKSINPDVYVIASSGYTIKSLTTDLSSEDVCAFIQKPFDTIRLVQAFEKAKLSKMPHKNLKEEKKKNKHGVF